MMNKRIQHYIVYYSNIEESRKADDKAYHVGGQFNLGYAAGLDVCCERFIEYVDGRYKV